MEITPKAIIGKLVADDIRLASVFDESGIDYCCQGDRSLAVAAADAAIPAEVLVRQLQAVAALPAETASSASDFTHWPLDLLADYIEKKHHRYITEQTPRLQVLLDKIATVHYRQHPELKRIQLLFTESAGELAMHLKKEELMLFPVIRKLAQAAAPGTIGQAAHQVSVQERIDQMHREHHAEGERFRKIRELSKDYLVPADGCSSYRAAFLLLEAFEADLHQHIHLENNILFPGAIALEQAHQPDITKNS